MLLGPFLFLAFIGLCLALIDGDYPMRDTLSVWDDEDERQYLAKKQAQWVPDANALPGIPAPYGHAPFHVALGYKMGHEEVFVKCGGSLISNSWVLTAAHCLVGNGSDHLDISHVALGVSGRNRGRKFPAEQVLKIRAVLVHSEFDPGTSKNDIGLALLEHPATLNEHIRRVRLPWRQGLKPKGNATVYGWGLNNKGNHTDNFDDFAVPKKLMMAVVNILPHPDCRRRFPWLNKGPIFGEGAMCAAAVLGNPAYADIGSALLCSRSPQNAPAAGDVQAAPIRMIRARPHGKVHIRPQRKVKKMAIKRSPQPEMTTTTSGSTSPTQQQQQQATSPQPTTTTTTAMTTSSVKSTTKLTTVTTTSPKVTLHQHTHPTSTTTGSSSSSTSSSSVAGASTVISATVPHQPSWAEARAPTHHTPIKPSTPFSSTLYAGADGGVYICGITTMAGISGDPDHPSVYTQVSMYRDWIRSAIKAFMSRTRAELMAAGDDDADGSGEHRPNCADPSKYNRYGIPQDQGRLGSFFEAIQHKQAPVATPVPRATTAAGTQPTTKPNKVEPTTASHHPSSKGYNAEIGNFFAGKGTTSRLTLLTHRQPAPRVEDSIHRSPQIVGRERTSASEAIDGSSRLKRLKSKINASDQSDKNDIHRAPDDAFDMHQDDHNGGQVLPMQPQPSKPPTHHQQTPTNVAPTAASTTPPLTVQPQSKTAQKPGPHQQIETTTPTKGNSSHNIKDNQQTIAGNIIRSSIRQRNRNWTLQSKSFDVLEANKQDRLPFLGIVAKGVMPPGLTNTITPSCFGVLLSDSFVLTAGECVTFDDDGTVKAPEASKDWVIFESDPGSTGKAYQTIQVAKRHLFDPFTFMELTSQRQNDLHNSRYDAILDLIDRPNCQRTRCPDDPNRPVVLELEKPVTFSSRAFPVNLLPDTPYLIGMRGLLVTLDPVHKGNDHIDKRLRRNEGKGTQQRYKRMLGHYKVTENYKCPQKEFLALRFLEEDSVCARRLTGKSCREFMPGSPLLCHPKSKYSEKARKRDSPNLLNGNGTAAAQQPPSGVEPMFLCGILTHPREVLPTSARKARNLATYTFDNGSQFSLLQPEQDDEANAEYCLFRKIWML